MIELSLGKMVLLALIALIVLGPEKLPGAARTAGALLRRVRSGWDNVKAEVERELEIEEIKRSAREAVASAEAAQQHVKDTLKEAHDPFAEAAAMIKLKPPASPNPVLTPEGLPAESLPPESGSHQAHPSQDPITADQTLEGLQSELPLNEPPGKPTHDKEMPHGNA